MIKVSAYKWVPPFAQGLVRDLRVRWALEEAGLPYEMKLVSLGEEQASPEYRAWQPFGQVPAYEEDGLRLFESGAIVLHIAEKSPALMPDDAVSRELVRQWLFTALNTIEWPILLRIQLFFNGIKDGPVRDNTMQWSAKRLHELAVAMNGRDYLVGDRFTAADLMMATVLCQLRDTDQIANEPAIAAYHARCTARAGYQKALADQIATFEANAPK